MIAIWVTKKLAANLLALPFIAMIAGFTGFVGIMFWGPVGILLVLALPILGFETYLLCDPPEGRGWAIRMHRWGTSK